LIAYPNGFAHGIWLKVLFGRRGAIVWAIKSLGLVWRLVLWCAKDRVSIDRVMVGWLEGENDILPLLGAGWLNLLDMRYCMKYREKGERWRGML